MTTFCYALQDVLKRSVYSQTRLNNIIKIKIWLNKGPEARHSRRKKGFLNQFAIKFVCFLELNSLSGISVSDKSQCQGLRIIKIFNVRRKV